MTMMAMCVFFSGDPYPSLTLTGIIGTAFGQRCLIIDGFVPRWLAASPSARHDVSPGCFGPTPRQWTECNERNSSPLILNGFHQP